MLITSDHSFSVTLNGRTVLSHTSGQPFITAGIGKQSSRMHLGHFKIKDTIQTRISLRHAEIEQNGSEATIRLRAQPTGSVLLTLRMEQRDENDLNISFVSAAPSLNRFWVRLNSDRSEKLYGCGEQLSYFNLKGRAFPLWTSEPGIGRDKTKLSTLAANCAAGAGGHYYNTSFPQPSYISSQSYLVHLQCSAYMRFDFRHAAYTELYSTGLPQSLHLHAEPSFLELAKAVGARFGRQPTLPEWIYSGVMLGVQGGTQAVLDKLRFAQENGVPVSSLWCQDWVGKRITSFGKRLIWNWEWNKEEYPDFDRVIADLATQGIRMLGYINPYVAVEGSLYRQGAEYGYFVKDALGEDYVLDFGEFRCGTVDLTNPAACVWYKNVIKKNMIGLGFSGWMADFSEYIPADARFHDGTTGETTHNLYPILWAKLNREAVDETSNTGKIVFFMRAGFTGAQGYCPLLWAGDQFVDFSRHDGLVSVVCAALSAGVLGNGLHHSDIGGYTSFLSFRRTKELFLRWAEMAAFTPVMRTHEGNRPKQNHQYYDDVDSAAMLGHLGRIHQALAPYLRQLIAQNSKASVPVQRPLFYHFPDDPTAYGLQDEYLLGEDLLVAPVYKRGAKRRKLYLPKGEWVHLFSGDRYAGGRNVTVSAPLGTPPVFFRVGSQHTALFEAIRADQNTAAPRRNGVNDMAIHFCGNWDEIKQHHERWWNAENSDRPLLAIQAPAVRGVYSPAADRWARSSIGENEPMQTQMTPEACERYWTDFDTVLNRYLALFECYHFTAETYPRMFANLGVANLALFLGGVPIFNEDTIWYKHVFEDIEAADIAFDKANKWLKWSLEYTKFAVGQANGRYLVGIPDINEHLDVLSCLFNSEQVMYDLLDHPDDVHRLLRKIQSAWFESYDLHSALCTDGDGFCNYGPFQLLGKGKVGKLQCDVSAMFSIDMFDEFALPYLKDQANYLDKSLYHLDGVDALKHLDSVLSIQSLTALQWTPGAGKLDGGDECWDSLYQKALDAGKNIYALVAPQNLARFIKKFGSRGVYIVTGALDGAQGEELVQMVGALAKA